MTTHKPNNPNEYRGYFIHEFAKLEYEIDYYLANFFAGTTELQNTLISIFIDRIPFESKRTALRSLLEIQYPKQNGNKNQKFGKVLDEIGKYARIRNEYAHFHTVNFINTKTRTAIALAKLRDEHKIIHYSIDDFNKQISDIQLCAKTIKDFRDALIRVRAGAKL